MKLARYLTKYKPERPILGFYFQPKDERKRESKEILGRILGVYYCSKDDPELEKASTAAFDKVIRGKNPRAVFKRLMDYQERLDRYDKNLKTYPLNYLHKSLPENPFKR